MINKQKKLMLLLFHLPCVTPHLLLSKIDAVRWLAIDHCFEFGRLWFKNNYHLDLHVNLTLAEPVMRIVSFLIVRARPINDR